MPLSALEDEDAVFFVQFDNLARPSAYQYVIVTPVVVLLERETHGLQSLRRVHSDLVATMRFLQKNSLRIKHCNSLTVGSLTGELDSRADTQHFGFAGC